MAKLAEPEAVMLPLLNKLKVIGLGLAAISLAVMLASPNLSLAQEPYPAVARISFVSGAVNYSRGDDPDEWDDAIQNVPLTIGDRIYSSADGRVELQLSSGNFVRLAPQSYFSNLNLSDDIKQFYLGEGIASFNIRRLPSGEVIEIDTPNISVTLDEPGNYRIAVDDNGDSRVTVRRGRVTVAANGRQIAVENSEMRIYGIDSPRYEIVGLPAGDAFDRWASERDTRFDRSYSDAYRYASDEIIGVEDLSDYGRWEQIPDYGYAWTPASVAAGWLPFSDGRWFWQDPWGWTWISNEQWGWATSHYGSWTQYRSRWYWVPARPRTRVVYAPACVEFVRVHDDIGWFPLHPRDRYVPWWDRRERERFDGNIMYVNRNYVTIVNQSTFISARPINKYIVRDSVIVRDARSARLTTVDLPVPNRSSIRIFSETGGHRGYKPPPNVLNRVAVVRTAPPLPPPTFQEKLPAIQKAQGKPIEPSQASTLISAADKARTERVPIRPAAEEVRGKEFSARNPSASSGPAPQPITAARGKKLATREALAVQPTPAGQNAGIAGKPAQDRERERQAQQQELDRRKQEQQKEQEQKAQLQERQQQQRLQEPEQGQRELERRQAQQTEEERQAQRQKQPQVQERREDQQPRPSREQQRLEELQRRQAQQEEVRKAQALQQEQEHGKQLKQQQQLQERQAQQQRELERQQQEQDRKAQALQQQQEQARRGQARQQPIQEQREPQRQKQQELEQGQPERRAQQQPNQGRIQQPRQHQSVENQAQQPRQPQSPENQAQQSKYPQSQRRQAEPQKEG
jgi:DNA segregation ATPase FtsK/SpoIIIE-like protein